MPSNDDASGHPVTRRTLVGGGAALLGATGPALAQRPAQPPRVKGPLVWLDMDQKELDDAYDQAVYAPNRDHVLKRCTRNSELVRARLGAPKRFAYGAGADRRPRCLHHQGRERAGQCLRAWRRLAHRARGELRLCGGDVRQCRRASRRARFQQRARDRRRSDGDGGAGAPRRRLGLQERRELRRRSRAALCVRPFFRRPSRGRAADHRLAEGLRRAADRHQGRRVRKRHVRSQAGAAVEAFEPM